MILKVGLIRKLLIKGSLFVLPFFIGQSLVLAEDLPIARSDLGRYYTLVEVDGNGTHPFMLDSGASNTAIYRRFSLMTDFEYADYKTRRVMTATGIAYYPLYRVPKMTMGQSVRNFKEMVVLPDADDRRVMGIVGTDFLRGHWLMLDSSKKTVRFEKTSVAVPEGWKKLQCLPVGVGSISALVKVGDVDVHAIIDTGAAVSVLNGPAAKELDLTLDKTRVPLAADVKGSGRTVGGSLATLPETIIGDIALKPQSVIVSDLPAFIRFGAHRVPAMILGMDIMKKFPILLNFSERCLYVKAADQG